MNDELPENIRTSIKERYTAIARSPSSEKDFPVGPECAKSLGYSTAEVDALPLTVTESFAGVGNPFTLGEIETGETVLDFGCGSGMDCILAARKVGPEGKVIGVDMTQEMVKKASGNAEALGLSNVEFRHGTIESLPVKDGSINVAISNGVFNLCPDKPAVATEIFRVLQAGGRLWMADILLEDHVTPEKVRLMGSWSG